MPYDVDILIEDARWSDVDLPALARKAVGAVLAAHQISRAEVSVLGCDDAKIAALNAEFRQKPTPTNVLSWPEEDLAPDIDGDAPHTPQPDHGGVLSLGDIAIAYETCAQEAAEHAKPIADHVVHLLVHGTLHLLGYDHIRDRDATRMEALEVDILGKLGLPDPY